MPSKSVSGTGRTAEQANVIERCLGNGKNILTRSVSMGTQKTPRYEMEVNSRVELDSKNGKQHDAPSHENKGRPRSLPPDAITIITGRSWCGKTCGDFHC